MLSAIRSVVSAAASARMLHTSAARASLFACSARQLVALQPVAVVKQHVDSALAAAAQCRAESTLRKRKTKMNKHKRQKRKKKFGKRNRVPWAS